MTTKQIGNIGEAKVLCKFVSMQIPVYVPFGDNERADLIAEFNGKLNRIQIKTSEKAEDGKMVFSLVSSTAHRQQGVKHKYTSEEIDYFALYNIARDELFLISINEPELPQTTITIRYETPKNHNQYKQFMSQDYTFEKQITKNI